MNYIVGYTNKLEIDNLDFRLIMDIVYYRLIISYIRKKEGMIGQTRISILDYRDTSLIHSK